jgi:hypothetical protein
MRWLELPSIHGWPPSDRLDGASSSPVIAKGMVEIFGAEAGVRNFAPHPPCGQSRRPRLIAKIRKDRNVAACCYYYKATFNPTLARLTRAGGTPLPKRRASHEGRYFESVCPGSTMDWMEDPRSDLWAFPRGMARDGGFGPGSAKWTSKYGSVATSFYNIGTADGINEAGLVANALYLVESD